MHYCSVLEDTPNTPNLAFDNVAYNLLFWRVVLLGVGLGYACPQY